MEKAGFWVYDRLALKTACPNCETLQDVPDKLAAEETSVTCVRCAKEFEVTPEAAGADPTAVAEPNLAGLAGAEGGAPNSGGLAADGREATDSGRSPPGDQRATRPVSAAQDENELAVRYQDTDPSAAASGLDELSGSWDGEDAEAYEDDDYGPEGDDLAVDEDDDYVGVGLPEVPADLAENRPTGGVYRSRRRVKKGTQQPNLTETQRRNSARMLSFPWSEMRAFLGRLISYAWARGFVFTLLTLVVILSPLLVATGAVLWSMRDTTQRAQVVAKSPLLAGPMPEQKVYPTVGVLQKGQIVRVLLETGDFALVHDTLGRVGYVALQKLSWRARGAQPDRPFVGCKKAPVEKDASGCLARAEAQLNTCLLFCSDIAEPSACQETCQARMARCQKICAPPAEAKAEADAPKKP